MNLQNFASIILAAGQGKRMLSSLPKVLHEIEGIPLAEYVIQSTSQAGIQKHCIVVGHEKEKVQVALSGEGRWFAVQTQPLGTGHAVLSAYEVIREIGATHCLILCGDTPCLKQQTLQQFLEVYDSTGSDLLVLSTVVDDPKGYGRILRDPQGNLLKIIEDKDCSDQQRSIQEINTGIYLGSCELVFDLLQQVGNDNTQGEYYLTDMIGIARERGFSVMARSLGEENEFLGVNDPQQLDAACGILTQRLAQ
jgi:bifunctional UDP-N-acetylglucosamine pyrophosphorylase / glucosamine-1-phosphate N-acetyltransferase